VIRPAGPVFAYAPAEISRQTCGVVGSAVTVCTWGLLLASEGEAVALHVDPTTMLVLGELLTRLGATLGGDPEAARHMLQCAAEDARPVEVRHA
jgi:hypothetical protein